MTLHIKFNRVKEIKTLIIPQVKSYYFDAIVSDYDEEFIPVLRYIIEEDDRFHFVNITRMCYFKEEK